MTNFFSQRIVRLLITVFLVSTLLHTSACSKREITIRPNMFARTETPLPNPMKGFACFYEKADQDSSLEYIGLKFNEIYSYQNGQGALLTEELDKKLSRVADRGNFAILRIYMLNPGYVDSERTGLFLPEELYNELKNAGDIYYNQVRGGRLEYPDFNSQKLIDCMLDFIALFGKRYDGNPAIAAIQMGLYGSWGEWNMSECRSSACVMTDDNLRKIIKAYVSSFSSTKLMGRNPSLGHANEYPIGYHDDNFMFNTSDFHTKSPEWKALLRKQHYTYATLQQFYDFINGNGGKAYLRSLYTNGTPLIIYYVNSTATRSTGEPLNNPPDYMHYAEYKHIHCLSTNTNMVQTDEKTIDRFRLYKYMSLRLYSDLAIQNPLS